jgi:hypothetical protein
VVDWADSKSFQPCDQFLGSVLGGVVHAQHQLSEQICQVKWHSFDNLGSDVITEKRSDEFGFGRKRGNHYETECRLKY